MRDHISMTLNQLGFCCPIGAVCVFSGYTFLFYLNRIISSPLLLLRQLLKSFYLHFLPEWLSPQGWRQRGLPPIFLLAPRRHLKFHAPSVLYKIRDPFLAFLGNTIGIICKYSRTPLTIGTLTALAPRSNFFPAPSVVLGNLPALSPQDLMSNIKVYFNQQVENAITILSNNRT